MKSVSLIALLMISFGIHAQNIPKSNWIIGPSIGYQYQEKNFLKASIWALTDLGYANYLKVDLGANITSANKEIHLIPEVGVTYYLGAKGAWPFIKAEVTPYTVSPKVGVGLFNLVELGMGYGFKVKQKKNLPPIEGFNVSLGFSLPLNYYLD